MLFLPISLIKSKDRHLSLSLRSFLVFLDTAFTYELHTDLNRNCSAVNGASALSI